jgi:imidazolonepropionase-like amidohydrolase
MSIARRFYQEAAKMLKYGDLTEEEALRLVTLNPAIQLRLEKRIGSIDVGKDADLVTLQWPSIQHLLAAGDDPDRG